MDNTSSIESKVMGAMSENDDSSAEKPTIIKEELTCAATPTKENDDESGCVPSHLTVDDSSMDRVSFEVDEKQDTCLKVQEEDGKSNEQEIAGGSGDPDLYHYTKGEEFTSEIFKIMLNNLPMRFGYNQLRKMLDGLDLKPKKIKGLSRSGYVFITFICEEDRKKALQVLNKHKWKGRNLSAKIAKPVVDPLLALKRKREMDERGDQDPEKRTKREDAECDEDEMTVEDRLNKAVTPLWSMDYQDQLNQKQEKKRALLNKFTDSLYHTIPEMRGWLTDQKKKHDGICCKLERITPSPVTTGYRNKCEFSIGTSPDGEGKTVGFRLGLYKGGQISVVNPASCLNVPDSSKAVVHAFQAYIRQSDLPAYDPMTHKGHWRMLTVRTTQGSEIMALVTLNGKTLSEETVEKEKEALVSFFRDGEGRPCGVTSLYIDVQMGQGTRSADQYAHIYGNRYITEDLLNLKFRISPEAFFQVNTKGAEALYTLIATWAEVGKNTTLLDICCGTGTIGISLAKNVDKVIGVELNQQAVDDAKANAAFNEVSNVSYYCGKAEDLLPTITSGLRHCLDVVGIVDPPRAGLHQRVVQAVRRCPNLNRLIYVSCDAMQVFQNLTNLCRPISKKMKGMPFKLIKAIPVDLFPHAKHCELVLLFERDLHGNDAPSSSSAT